MSAILEFQGVSGIGKGFSLKEISFVLEPGYIMGVTGKNGAGKTTLLKTIIEPDIRYQGEILLNGTKIENRERHYMNHIGYVAEDNIFQKYWSAAKNAELYSKVYDNWDMKLFQQYMSLFDIILPRKVGLLSRGEFIKFQMAFAIAHHSKLFLLDEATAGMDPVFRREFFQIIRRLMEPGEVSVIMTTQIMEELEFKVDYVAVMEEGRMVSFKEAL